MTGVRVNGVSRTVNKPGGSSWVDITKVESPPFSTIAAKTMKPSQNNYAETILWTLGEKYRPDWEGDLIKVTTEASPTPNSDQLGLAAVKGFLENMVHIPADAVVQH